MKTYLLRGVPASLQMDSWWLSATSTGVAPPKARGKRNGRADARPPIQALLLLALIVIADWLFWDHGQGFSLALFAGVLAMAVMAVLRPRFSLRSGGIAAAILGVGLLPVLVYVQFLSVVFGIATLLVFAAYCASKGQGKPSEVLRAALWFLLLAPQSLLWDIMSGSDRLRHSREWQGVGRGLIRNWLLPALVGTVFLILLLLGNPMFEHIFSQFPAISTNPARLVFWALILAFVWPFLAIESLRQKMLRPFAWSLRSTPVAPLMLNAESVRNSLVVFNLMFAGQTVLDMVYLWGGAELPKGITLASYAHRGAYPLVATALLAGLFALISRPYAQTRPLLKGLLLLWLAQNLALVGASVLRLQLYVDSFGLTYLRLAAFIWMGMVAAGLVLIGCQLFRAKSNGWLLTRISALLVTVLYICSLINFANVIARNNLSRNGEAVSFIRMDTHYICALGPMALPAITDFERDTGQTICQYGNAPSLSEIRDWREWGFRAWQVQRYLANETGPKDVP